MDTSLSSIDDMVIMLKSFSGYNVIILILLLSGLDRTYAAAIIFTRL